MEHGTVSTESRLVLRSAEVLPSFLWFVQVDIFMMSLYNSYPPSCLQNTPPNLTSHLRKLPPCRNGYQKVASARYPPSQKGPQICGTWSCRKVRRYAELEASWWSHKSGPWGNPHWMGPQKASLSKPLWPAWLPKRECHAGCIVCILSGNNSPVTSIKNLEFSPKDMVFLFLLVLDNSPVTRAALPWLVTSLPWCLWQRLPASAMMPQWLWLNNQPATAFWHFGW